MLRFACDYQEGCLPEILERLNETNMSSQPGYGFDDFCQRARDLVRQACGAPGADVHFLVGGTQTNSIVLHGMMRNFEAVVAVESGHILGHEAGAVEAKGHKIFTLPSVEGRMTADNLRAFLRSYDEEDGREHLAVPRVVYISFSTELGTLYSLAELEELRRICSEHGLLLFIDGARLGYALASRSCDVSLKDLARIADVFYIGGTKCGALLGEAVVVPNPQTLPNFFTTMKQGGAVLAKGRLLGIQFEVLFEGERYIEVCRSAVEKAEIILEALREKGVPLEAEPGTNLIFCRFAPEQLAKLEASGVILTRGGRCEDGSIVCRIATSWATTSEKAEKLAALIRAL